jgi:hypothetical protein
MRTRRRKSTCGSVATPGRVRYPVMPRRAVAFREPVLFKEVVVLRAVIHQTYNGTVAVDTSGFSNNGIPVDVKPTTPGFAFDGGNSRISVPGSSSLSILSSIRAAVRFTLTPGGVPHRYNLMEGFESFAFFVEPDQSLTGTIYDANENWTGATSPPNTVAVDAEHIGILECDGINMVRVWLDGQVVAETYNVDGQVRGVGALGLAVGHWPNPPNQYTFEGVIFEALLQKYDKEAELAQLLDPCCFDREALNKWFARVERKGVSREQLVQAAGTLEQALRQAVISVRGDDPAVTLSQQMTALALNQALLRRDGDAAEAAVSQAQALVDANTEPATRAAIAEQVQSALNAFGLSWMDWCQLLRIFCLDLCEDCRG